MKQSEVTILAPWPANISSAPQDSSLVAPNSEQEEQCSLIQVRVAHKNFLCLFLTSTNFAMPYLQVYAVVEVGEDSY